jgi:hypothetical protein
MQSHAGLSSPSKSGRKDKENGRTWAKTSADLSRQRVKMDHFGTEIELHAAYAAVPRGCKKQSSDERMILLCPFPSPLLLDLLDKLKMDVTPSSGSAFSIKRGLGLLHGGAV